MKTMIRKAGRLLAVCLMMAALLAAAGCQEGKGTDNPKSSSGTVTEVHEKQAPPAEEKGKEDKKPQELAIKVYYPNDAATKLVAVKRKIKTTAAEDKYTAAIKSLMQGTKEKGQSTIIPKQAKLRSVKVEKGVAKVDFSQDIIKNFVGGSTGEEMLVGSVVNTLTEFPEVKQVQILVEGNSIESLAGHMDLSTPLSRMDDLL